MKEWSGTGTAAASGSEFRRVYEDIITPAAALVRRRRISRERLTAAAALLLFAVLTAAASALPGLFRQPESGGERNWFSMLLISGALSCTAYWFLRQAAARRTARDIGRNIIRPLARSIAEDLRYDAVRRQEDSDAMAESALFGAPGGRYDRQLLEGIYRGTCGGRRYILAPILTERAVPHGCRIRRGLVFSGWFASVTGLPDDGTAVLFLPKAGGIDAEAAAARLALAGVNSAGHFSVIGDQTAVFASPGSSDAAERYAAVFRLVTAAAGTPSTGLSVSKISGRFSFAAEAAAGSLFPSPDEYASCEAWYQALVRCRNGILAVIDAYGSGG